MLLPWVLSHGLLASPLSFVASGEVSTPQIGAISTEFNMLLYATGL